MIRSEQSASKAGAPAVASPADRPRRKVIVELTTRCNLRCSYCYAPHGGQDLDVPKFLEWAKTQRLDGITFFGGEPLLMTDAIAEICERFPGVRKSMTTNATMLTNDVAKFLRKRRIDVNCSIDGPPNIHRIARGDAGLAAFRGLECLWRYELRPTIRGTYYRTRDGYRMLERVRWANDLYDKCLIRSATFTGSDYRAEDPAFADEMDEVGDYLIGRHRDGRRIAYSGITKMIHLRPESSGLVGCGAGRSLIAYAADGSLWNCHRRTCDAVRYESNAEWLEAYKRANRPEKCLFCDIRAWCPGPCQAMAVLYTGNYNEPTPGFCAEKKAFHRQAMKLMAAGYEPPSRQSQKPKAQSPRRTP